MDYHEAPEKIVLNISGGNTIAKRQQSLRTLQAPNDWVDLGWGCAERKC
jgi:hypothetical protein